MIFLRKITALVNRLLSKTFHYDSFSKKKINTVAKQHVGTVYGGNVIPENLLHKDSVCYLAGAGEDLSFDAAIVRKFGCGVHIFDPTPKAIKHFQELREAMKNKRPFFINNNPVLAYEISTQEFSLMNFHPLGFWDRKETLRFYAPADPAHASYSALNIQQTEAFIEAKVDSIKNIMHSLNHDHIDLLKLDIEGAEIRVINSLIQDNLDVRILCIGLDIGDLIQMKNTIQNLIDHNYIMIDANANANYTFVRKDMLKV